MPTPINYGDLLLGGAEASSPSLFTAALGPVGIFYNFLKLGGFFDGGGMKEGPPMTPMQEIQQALSQFQQPVPEGGTEGRGEVYQEVMRNAVATGDQSIMDMVLGSAPDQVAQEQARSLMPEAAQGFAKPSPDQYANVTKEQIQAGEAAYNDAMRVYSGVANAEPTDAQLAEAKATLKGSVAGILDSQSLPYDLASLDPFNVTDSAGMVRQRVNVVDTPVTDSAGGGGAQAAADAAAQAAADAAANATVAIDPTLTGDPSLDGTEDVFADTSADKWLYTDGKMVLQGAYGNINNPNAQEAYTVFNPEGLVDGQTYDDTAAQQAATDSNGNSEAGWYETKQSQIDTVANDPTTTIRSGIEEAIRIYGNTPEGVRAVVAAANKAGVSAADVAANSDFNVEDILKAAADSGVGFETGTGTGGTGGGLTTVTLPATPTGVTTPVQETPTTVTPTNGTGGTGTGGTGNDGAQGLQGLPGASASTPIVNSLFGINLFKSKAEMSPIQNTLFGRFRGPQV